jgi:hypothetical protein
MRDLLGDAVRRHPELADKGLDPGFLEQQLGRLRDARPPAGDRPPQADRPTRPLPQPEKGARRPPTGDVSKPAPRPTTRTAPPQRPPAPPAEQAARREWAQRLADWAAQFPTDKLAGSLRDSPAVQNLLRDLSAAGAKAWGGGEGLDAQLARWQSQLQAARDWLPRQWPDAIRNHLPDLSAVPRPDVNWPDFDVHPALASGPGELSIDGSGLATTVLYVVAAVGTLAVLWKLRALPLSPEVGTRRARRVRPLDPGAVATRADLIRAFEHLSLVRCGEPARAWHHRAIAARLGGTAAERRAAAARLAALYEQARYAPAGAAPEPDWTAARRPLSLLARTGA